MWSLNFETAANQAIDAREGVEELAIRLDGRVMMLRKPTAAQYAVAQGALNRKDLGRFLHFMLSFLADPQDRDHIQDRLEDPEDPFEIYVDEHYEGVTLLSIWKAIVEEMSARPTSSQPVSSGSRSTTGKPSTGTARPKATRRSTSRSTAS
jgi:hypothetical protein